MRLIQSLPTPAIAAAGGPRGLLNITRLLAAQDLAKGNAPASFGSISRGDRICTDQSSVGSVTGDEQAEPVVPKRNSKLVDTPSSDQDSLLKVKTVLLCIEVRFCGFACVTTLKKTHHSIFAILLHALSSSQTYQTFSLAVRTANMLYLRTLC